MGRIELRQDRLECIEFRAASGHGQLHDRAASTTLGKHRDDVPVGLDGHARQAVFSEEQAHAFVVLDRVDIDCGAHVATGLFAGSDGFSESLCILFVALLQLVELGHRDAVVAVHTGQACACFPFLREGDK